MKIESYKNPFLIQNDNQKKQIKRTDDADSVQNNGNKLFSNDVLDISDDVLKMRNIKTRLETGFYDDKEVLTQTARKIFESL